MMKFFLIVIEVAALIIAGTTALENEVNDDAYEADDEAERIIDGYDAAEGQYPWMVALHYHGKFICSSTILTPRIVLTAAHCVFNHTAKDPFEADLFHGIANVNRNANHQVIYFEWAKPHPGYEGHHHDLALLKTTRDIAFSGTVGPICLPKESILNRLYLKGTAMGWGYTNPPKDKALDNPEVLQATKHFIYPNKLCSHWFKETISPSQMCARGLKSLSLFSGTYSGICNGDSGGPLVHQSFLGPSVQIGIASFIKEEYGCGSKAPSVWVRPDRYFHFINEISEDSICWV